MHTYIHVWGFHMLPPADLCCCFSCFGFKFVWNRVLVCNPGWLQTTCGNLAASASWVAEITNVQCHAAFDSCLLFYLSHVFHVSIHAWPCSVFIYPPKPNLLSLVKCPVPLCPSAGLFLTISTQPLIMQCLCLFLYVFVFCPKLAN